MTVIQKEVALRVMEKTFMELKKRVESLANEKSFLLQMNDEVLQR